MGRVGLVRTLKGAILFLAAMAALCYAVIFPQRIQEAGAAYNAAWMITPGIVCISISAVPIAIALVLFWQICTEIGRDNSFSAENAKSFAVISRLAALMAAVWFAGVVFLAVVHCLGPEFGIFMILIAFICIVAAVLSAALSHLVYKSYEMRQENELTI